MLTNPFSKNIHGQRIGITRRITEARIAMNKIIAAQKAGLFSGAISSANPEERLYSIEGLYKGRV